MSTVRLYLWLNANSIPVDVSKMGGVDIADDLEALRVHLGLPEVSVLGRSNSGGMALSFAERCPDRVGKAVRFDSQGWA